MSNKVMVIDDDRNATKFMSVVLSENGYDSIMAYDGHEGLQRIEESKDIDLIVLDVMMPKKTGFVLFKRLGKREGVPGHSDLDAHRRRGIAQGARFAEDDTFERPYDSLRESLRKTLQELRESGKETSSLKCSWTSRVDPDAFIKQVKGAHRRLTPSARGRRPSGSGDARSLCRRRASGENRAGQDAGKGISNLVRAQKHSPRPRRVELIGDGIEVAEWTDHDGGAAVDGDGGPPRRRPDPGDELARSPRLRRAALFFSLVVVLRLLLLLVANLPE